MQLWCGGKGRDRCFPTSMDSPGKAAYVNAWTEVSYWFRSHYSSSTTILMFRSQSTYLETELSRRTDNVILIDGCGLILSRGTVASHHVVKLLVQNLWDFGVPYTAVSNVLARPANLLQMNQRRSSSTSTSPCKAVRHLSYLGSKSE